LNPRSTDRVESRIDSQIARPARPAQRRDECNRNKGKRDGSARSGEVERIAVGAVALDCNRITSSRPRCIRSNLVAVVSDKLSPRCILAGDPRRRGRGGEGRGVGGGGAEEDEKRSDGGGNAIGDREKFAAREIRREKADMATSTISNKGVQYFRRHELAPASLFTLSPLSGNAGKAPLFFPSRARTSLTSGCPLGPRGTFLFPLLYHSLIIPLPPPPPRPLLSLSLSLSFSARSYLEIASVCLPRARGFRSKIRYPCTLYSVLVYISHIECAGINRIGQREFRA